MRVAVTVTSPSDGRASSARCTASPVASAAMGAVVQGSPFSSVPKLSVNVPQTGCTPCSGTPGGARTRGHKDTREAPCRR